MKHLANASASYGLASFLNSRPLRPCSVAVCRTAGLALLAWLVVGHALPGRAQQPPAENSPVHWGAYLRDGRLLTVRGSEGRLARNPARGDDEVFELPPGARAISLGPDDRTLAIASARSGVVLWDLAARAKLREWKVETDPSGIEFSRDGTLLAWVEGGGTRDSPATGPGSLHVANLRQEEPPRAYALGGRIDDLAFRRDGRTLVAAVTLEGRGSLRLLEIETGRTVPLAESVLPYHAIAYSVDGNWFAAATSQSLVVWDADAKKKHEFHDTVLPHTLSFGISRPGEQDFAFKFALFPGSHGQWLGWGAADGLVRIWQAGTERPRTVRGRSTIRSLTFDPTGRMIAALTDQAIQLWGDLPSNEADRLEPVADDVAPLAVTVHPLPLEQAAIFAPLVSADARWTLEAEATPVAPVIDGLLDEWQDAPKIAFGPGAPHVSSNPAYQLRNDGPSEPAGTVGTVADLSGQFSIRWDEDAIYLAAWVRDNVHDVRGPSSERWWEKDSVSLFLDVPRDGDGPSWISGDHAFSFVADPAPSADAVWWRHGEGKNHVEVAAPDEVRRAIRLTGDGYSVEAAIPMTVLSRFTDEWRPPYQEQLVGWMLLVADSDGGAEPYGGELVIGGHDDHDGQWARLRLVSRGASTAPQMEVPLRADRQRRTADARVAQLLAELQLPQPFRAELFAMVPSGPSRMAFGPDGRLFVTAGGWGPGGKVWALSDADTDGVAEQRDVVIEGLHTPMGLAFLGPDLYVTHRSDGLGRVSLYRRATSSDRYQFVKDVLTTGPGHGHGIGNIQVGPDGRLYVSQGSKGDLEVGDSPYDCTIWRMDPDGSHIEMLARGMRFAYGFAFDAEGRLFATEQGPNHLPVPHPDELNYITPGSDYGFPRVLIPPHDTAGTTGPVATFAEHASACGVGFYTGTRFPREYHGNAFVALWGPADPNHVDLVANPRPQWDAYYVARVELDGTKAGRVSRFAGDFRHPIDVVMGPDQALYVADWGSTGINGSQTGADGDGAIIRIDVKP